jgi:hypothetical protein
MSASADVSGSLVVYDPGIRPFCFMLESNKEER